MAAWNVAICSSASSLLKLSSKNRVEQVLRMAPTAPVSPSTIRGEAGEQYCSGQQSSASKRAYHAAFGEQMVDEEMVEEEEIVGGAGGLMLKKRRLTIEQVRFLESSFESENKLEPERKVEIAQRLGLQPRQVAVWFQNRRARSKSKQLERDFASLKADYHAVLIEKEKLQAEIDKLIARLQEEGWADVGYKGDRRQQRQQRLMLTDNLFTKTSGSSSNDYPHFADKNPKTESVSRNVDVKDAGASSGSVSDDELWPREEPHQTCSLPLDASVVASVTPALLSSGAAAAAVRAMASDCASSYYETPFEDFHCFSSYMQQACVHHQLFDLCPDFSLFVTALDDPWVDY